MLSDHKYKVLLELYGATMVRAHKEEEATRGEMNGGRRSLSLEEKVLLI